MKFKLFLVLVVLVGVAVALYLGPPETCEPPPQGRLVLGEQPGHWNEWDDEKRQEWRNHMERQERLRLATVQEKCRERQGLKPPPPMGGTVRP